MQCLMGQFPGKVISKRGDIIRPPRSPDLAICDFFLWGYLKQTIWNVPVELHQQNLQQLRDAVIRACNGINRDMIANSFDGMLRAYRKKRTQDPQRDQDQDQDPEEDPEEDPGEDPREDPEEDSKEDPEEDPREDPEEDPRKDPEEDSREDSKEDLYQDPREDSCD